MKKSSKLRQQRLAPYKGWRIQKVYTARGWHYYAEKSGRVHISGWSLSAIKREINVAEKRVKVR